MTLGPGYFSDVYAAAPDPYGLADRWYEDRKYAVTLALLPRRRYASAFEPGCSVGVLTARLAERCDTLLACDAVPGAVRAARARVAGRPGVRVEQRVIPTDWPAGPQAFDLIVCSELLYYFGDADLSRVLDLAAAALRPDGHLVAVHWRHPAPDHPRTGDATHQALAAHPGLTALGGYRDPDFNAEVFGRAGDDHPTVAEAEGIV